MRSVLVLVFAVILCVRPAVAQEDVELPAPDDVEIVVEAPETGAELEIDAELDPAPDLEADAGGYVMSLRGAIESGAWPVVVGLLLVAVVYVLRRLGIEDAIGGSKALPWLTLALSVIGNLGAALAVGVDITTALWAALGSAATAVFAWDLGGVFAPKEESTTT